MKQENNTINHLSITLISQHHTNRSNFLQFILNYKNLDLQETKIKFKNYYYLNLKIVFILIVLKIFDIITTFIGLSTGLARESNALVVVLLDQIALLYFISFIPILGLSLLNYYVFKARRLSLLKVIMASCCFLTILLIITVVNNIVVLNLALS
ncbi:MAG: hypothetical protein JW891_17255 [Candidatus Lokiarchaeota archaeon]|nr:hypothetical protein [Candidatus Lokiarchaeota archaeon]